METESAYIVLYVILAAGVVVWFFGVLSWLRTFGSGADTEVRGEVEYEVEPSKVRQGLTRLLASGAGGGVSARILDASDHQVVAELTLMETIHRKGRARTRQRSGAILTCRLEPRLNGCLLRYQMDLSATGRGMRIGGVVLLALGVVALASVAILMPALVIEHEDSAIRGQVWQSLQVIHFLWPPYLLAFVTRRTRSMIQVLVEDMLRNMRFLLQDE